jgi:hypothetical protein
MGFVMRVPYSLSRKVWEASSKKIVEQYLISGLALADGPADGPMDGLADDENSRNS